MAQELEEGTSQRTHEVIGRPKTRVEPLGPTRTLVAHETFEEFHLLSNYSKWLSALYAKRLSPTPTIHEMDLPDPTDYTDVFRATDQMLAKVTKGLKAPGPSFAFI